MPDCIACPNPAAIGPWCARCCPSSRKRVVAAVGLPPDPHMPAPGRYSVGVLRGPQPTRWPPRQPVATEAA